jgi:hypothetical protein
MAAKQSNGKPSVDAGAGQQPRPPRPPAPPPGVQWRFSHVQEWVEIPNNPHVSKGQDRDQWLADAGYGRFPLQRFGDEDALSLEVYQHRDAFTHVAIVSTCDLIFGVHLPSGPDLLAFLAHVLPVIETAARLDDRAEFLDALEKQRASGSHPRRRPAEPSPSSN